MTRRTPQTDLDQPSGAAKQQTILYVEPNDDVRSLVARALEQAGFRVLQAQSALEALEATASESAIDLLFTEVVIAGMSGPALAAKLSLHSEIHVLITSDDPEGCTERGHDLTRWPFLEKPSTLIDSAAPSERQCTRHSQSTADSQS